MALARAAEVTDSSTESCLGNVAVADPWPVNERSVLYTWLSALFSRRVSRKCESIFAGSLQESARHVQV